MQTSGQVVPTDTDEGMEDATMGSTFDIFKVTSDGPLWVEVVHGLEEAKERMGCLALTSPGEYFIHSQEQGVVAKAEGDSGRQRKSKFTGNFLES